MPARVWRACAALSMLALAALSACSGRAPAPIDERAPVAAPQVPRPAPAPPRATTPAPAAHTVERGDTVHGIAWRYGLDHRDLIRWNRLSNPNLIHVGQRLRLTAPPDAARAAPPGSPPPAARAENARAPVPAPAPTPGRDASGALGWTWPAQGRVARANSLGGIKGVEIRGERGQEIKAAAPGTVVYSGSGLRGYGELIILQHNETFLSAYAHNDVRLVQEGNRVAAGTPIARMGDTDAKDVMLHFEIRRNGKAVDPLHYLPRR